VGYKTLTMKTPGIEQTWRGEKTVCPGRINLSGRRKTFSTTVQLIFIFYKFYITSVFFFFSATLMAGIQQFYNKPRDDHWTGN
jgi:hypothetical protein